MRQPIKNTIKEIEEISKTSYNFPSKESYINNKNFPLERKITFYEFRSIKVCVLQFPYFTFNYHTRKTHARY